MGTRLHEGDPLHDCSSEEHFPYERSIGFNSVCHVFVRLHHYSCRGQPPRLLRARRFQWLRLFLRPTVLDWLWRARQRRRRIRAALSDSPRCCGTEANVGHFYQLHYRVRQDEPRNFRRLLAHVHDHPPLPIPLWRDEALQDLPPAIPGQRQRLVAFGPFLGWIRGLHIHGSPTHLPSWGWVMFYCSAVAIFCTHMCLGWQKVVPAPSLDIPKRFHSKAIHVGYVMTAFVGLIYVSFPIYTHLASPTYGYFGHEMPL